MYFDVMLKEGVDVDLHTQSAITLGYLISIGDALEGITNIYVMLM